MGRKSLHVENWLDALSPVNEVAAVAVRRRRKQNQVDFDTEFFATVLRNNPRSIDVLRIEGELLSHRQKHIAALAIDLRLAEICPEDCVVHYNLACSLAVLGRHEAALRELRRAFQFGYSDVAYMERDPDLANLRRCSGYQTLVDEFSAASGEFYLELELGSD